MKELMFVKVRLHDASYTYTARGGGKSASCTGTKEGALSRLAEKLFGNKKYDCKYISSPRHGVQEYIFTAQK